MNKLLMATAMTGCLALLTACPKTGIDAPEEAATEATEIVEVIEAEAPSAMQMLDAAFDNQSDELKARYQYRHPKETLAFLGIEPGMTVVEVLPGGGWYSKILLSYLGSEGALVGVDYSLEMWPLFGGFVDEEFLEKRKSWTTTWIVEAEEWRGEGDAVLAAGVYGSMPDEAIGTVDAILLIRAVHHLNRFEEEGGFFTQATTEMLAALKPGGIVGIVQHRAPEGNDDKWAEGDNGYVKQSHVIAFLENAGFEFVGSSEINANPKDQPTNEDIVWRLPPTLGTSKEDEALKAQMLAIGESDRMTLKFRKPE